MFRFTFRARRKLFMFGVLHGRSSLMISDIQDTIVALSSASGPGGRAIVRLSGPKAFDVAFGVFKTASSIQSNVSSNLPLPRRRHEGSLQLPSIEAPIPAT